jgi:hypothetical protein
VKEINKKYKCNKEGNKVKEGKSKERKKYKDSKMKGKLF